MRGGCYGDERVVGGSPPGTGWTLRSVTGEISELFLCLCEIRVEYGFCYSPLYIHRT